jgi:tRNA A-37 threonylcarbamoyl transferase component Bud32
MYDFSLTLGKGECKILERLSSIGLCCPAVRFVFMHPERSFFQG